MVAFINSVVAGAGITLLAYNAVAPGRMGVALALGAATAVALMVLFVVFQRWRFGMVRLATPLGAKGPNSDL
jgi:hypothetical protein